MNVRNEKIYWFIFYNDQLLLQKEKNGYTVPSGEKPPIALSRSLEIILSDGSSGRAASVDAPPTETDSYKSVSLRATWDFLASDLYRKAGKAFQLIHWDRNSRFCSACGTETVQTTPVTKQCPACGKEIYPGISAAILVLVKKKDAILLVHAHNFKGTFNSLVAGFLETGETLEECVAREVREETGLEIENIAYFGNQPWPYPSGLMVGFTADYAKGEIRLQEEELSSGSFYTRDCLPELPRKLSLARKMIDWWLEQK